MTNFIKIRPVGAQLFDEVGRTHMKLTLALGKFANASQNIQGYSK